jgi:3-oxoacyl-[acyl-carrier-protein] synthase II
MTAPSNSTVLRRSAGTPRVVVTGIGLRTGLGLSAQETWENLKAGRQAFRVLDVPTAPGTPPYVGCPVARPVNEALGTLCLAADAAYSDAGLRLPHEPGGHDLDRERAAVVVGMSKGDLGKLSEMHRALYAREPDAQKTLEDWELMTWPNSVAAFLAHFWDFRGPCLAPVAACATGLIAALQGAALIRRGVCDLAVVGAGDASLEPLVLGAFRRMGVLARVDVRAGDDPARALRPWDKNRSGFLVGEGAAVLVLERDDHARARGVAPYAELAGGASGADAHHLTDLNPDPTGLAHVIGRALADAGVAVGEIDHVNVHGTATLGNDPLECRALRMALGPRADRVACSANKGQIGHLLGAAGAAELAITCLALRDGFIPPTLNLTDPDPACDLDGTPLVGRRREIDAALKLSIGFGGHLAVAVVKRWENSPRDGR